MWRVGGAARGHALLHHEGGCRAGARWAAAQLVSQCRKRLILSGERRAFWRQAAAQIESVQP